jgi:hypothetical protein
VLWLNNNNKKYDANNIICDDTILSVGLGGGGGRCDFGGIPGGDVAVLGIAIDACRGSVWEVIAVFAEGGSEPLRSVMAVEAGVLEVDGRPVSGSRFSPSENDERSCCWRC